MAQYTLTAEQVARRLGVKVETVYAYVSRGVLGRKLAEDGRTSRFDKREVEEVARRGRPRKGRYREGGIDVTIATAITGIVSDRLLYRGHDVAVLASSSRFESVAELLWTGTLADSTDWNVPKHVLELARSAASALPESAGPLERLAAAAAALAAAHPLRIDLRETAVVEHGRVLLTGFSEVLGAPSTKARPRPSIATRLLGGLSPLSPTPARVALLDATLVVLADHELATSTLAARVAASTRADPFAVALAGLGAVSGPLHGKAAVHAHRMILDVLGASPPEVAVARALETCGFVPGFRHPVYSGVDPRAAHLLTLLPHVVKPSLFERLQTLARAASKAASGPENVDYALGAVAIALEMPLGATEAIFAVARTAGWIAHALEEYGEAPLRFRARSMYVGRTA